MRPSKIDARIAHLDANGSQRQLLTHTVALGPDATIPVAGQSLLRSAGIGADRIRFGTDYGVNGGSRGDVSASIRTLEGVLTPAERQLIFVDNSLALLKAKGRT